MLREAVMIQRKVLGDHRDTAFSLNLLGRVVEEASEAERLHREALAIQKKALSPDPDLRLSLIYLGWSLWNQHKLPEAEAALRESLGVATNYFDRRHPLITGNMHQLARLLIQEGKNAEAESLLREAITIRERLPDDFKPRLTTLHNHLALALLKQGEFDEAAAFCKESANQYRRGGESADMSEAEALNNMAWFLATCEIAEFRRGSNAVLFAEKTVELTNRRNPRHLDTLAAAYAERANLEKPSRPRTRLSL
jgi:tetratricopeptide (TPR) repeat protein